MKFLDNDGLEYMVGKIAGLVGGSGSADFIVEQGTYYNWTYRKWASGISECWGRWTATTTSWSAWGSVYEGNNYLANLSFPTGLFNAIPIVTAQVGLNGMSGGVMTEMGQVSQTSIGYVIPIRPNTFSQPLDYEYSIYAKGYWKTFTPGVAHSDPSADYIFERGTSGIWTYRKWNSGLAECWAVWGGQLTHYATPITGLYGYYVQMGLPAIFDSSVLPVIQVTAGVGNGFAWSGASMPASYTGTSFNAYAISTLSGTNTVTFNMSVKGRWKPW